VKLKTLAVITLVVLGCSFASAQGPGTFTFWDAAGTQPTCGFIVITYNSGGVVAGYDDETACGIALNAPIVGFDATTPALGLPAHGKGAVVGDAIYDASAFAYTGLQWTLWISAKVSKKKHGFFSGPYGWIGVAGSYTGFYFGDNYGYLAAGPPEKGEVAGHATTAGKLREKLRK
jgi:hypothetical protein